MVVCGSGTMARSGTKSRSANSKPSRREEYAEATRQAILDSARKLFSERGYFSTRVDDIAAQARVAPATVYAVSGGKQGLLHTLVDLWSTAPAIEKTLRGVEALADPRAVIRLTAQTCVSMRQEFGDIIHILLNTAPHDAETAQTLAAATEIYRKAILRIARHMARLGGLRKGVSVEEIADVLWFYFGYSALNTLVDENHWTWERAERWLADAAIRVLLAGK
jgi:AcrR family transcriptional regulator